jgi:hypothetical protein
MTSVYVVLKRKNKVKILGVYQNKLTARFAWRRAAEVYSQKHNSEIDYDDYLIQCINGDNYVMFQVVKMPLIED